ncbi:MAG: hypothetical protein ACI398_07275 [Clostridium sp.]
MDRIEELKSLIRFYEEQLGEDEGDLYEEYEVELVAAIDELNRLTKKVDYNN